MSKKNPRDRVWITRDKRKIKLRDMTDSHLRNAMKWALQCADDLDDMALNMIGYAASAPDGAAMAAESEAYIAMEEAMLLRAWAAAFQREMKYRGDNGDITNPYSMSLPALLRRQAN